MVGVVALALACGETEAPGTAADGGVDAGETCLVRGVRYPKGPVPSEDCNTCYCDPLMGGVSCTLRGCGDGAPPPPIDSGVIEAGPSAKLTIDGTTCTPTRVEVRVSQPPDGHYWQFLLDASCPSLGVVETMVTGYDNRGYPLTCGTGSASMVATVSVRVASEDAAGPFVASNGVGDCTVTTGPVAASRTTPAFVATVTRDAVAHEIRFSP